MLVAAYSFLVGVAAYVTLVFARMLSWQYGAFIWADMPRPNIARLLKYPPNIVVGIACALVTFAVLCATGFYRGWSR